MRHSTPDPPSHAHLVAKSFVVCPVALARVRVLVTSGRAVG